MNLSRCVKDDIIAFLKRADNELLFNERDLQVHLCTWLRNSKNAYDDVDIEYYVPYRVLDDYIWNNELRLDLVVEKDGEYLPIELKYKTKAISRNIKRFGQDLVDKEGSPFFIQVVKNQGAKDLGMYDFWKDVRRIELINQRFERVKGGLALFLTNDKSYLKEPRSTSNNYLFSMSNGVHALDKRWQNPQSATALGHPDFKVKKEYEIVWDEISMQDVDMYYCILTI